MERLLVVEDDDSIAAPLVRALLREGFDVEHVTTGEEAIARLSPSRTAIDLVVLDLGLPGIDGIGVCQHVRDEHPGVGVLMLTARSSELDEVIGLDAGADDYVTKPFSLAVLIARIRALLRREGHAPGEPAATGGLRVDREAHRAWRDGSELQLSPKEFELLALLVSQPGRTLRREDIMAAVWDENWWGSTKTLDVHMGWLRQKLGDPPIISTVRGVGFRLESG